MLIREREARCADGVVPACEYFKSGYFDDDELLYEVYTDSTLTLFGVVQCTILALSTDIKH